jgi:hypothetical protein
MDYYIGTMIQFQTINSYVSIAAFQNQIGGNYSLLPAFFNPFLPQADITVVSQYQNTDSQNQYSHYFSWSYNPLPGTNGNTLSIIQNQFQEIDNSSTSAQE